MAVYDVAGKVAVVSGGGSGIGEGACRALAREGARVAVLDVRSEAAETVAASIRDAGDQAVALAADVTDEAAVQAAVTATVERFGGLHVVFANAGINGMQTPIEEMTLEEWNATIAVTQLPDEGFRRQQHVAEGIPVHRTGPIQHQRHVQGRQRSGRRAPAHADRRVQLTGGKARADAASDVDGGGPRVVGLRPRPFGRRNHREDLPLGQTLQAGRHG